MKRRQSLRRSLSLLQEMQHNTPTVISVSHYNDLWHRTIEELIGPDFLAWGKNIFSLLSKDGSNEDITETVRAWNRLNEHLDGLVEATGDLAALAHQVDPRAISKHVKIADFQNAQARVWKDALVQMLDLRAKGVESLRKAELRKELLYQIDQFRAA
ncbi:hypothetical protein SCHPADRAFT_751142 [Schizopora paradoxa]|uniref:Uncharacterized protein n=1 Tax=Schizopora paradoxa TaxID=27342 RepID=A0A0H2QY99_9AGAM|nr:hypothetical protein SCHPADRAFT_751142 [Schizopora paradoxa]